jgi:hypothetical protein
VHTSQINSNEATETFSEMLTFGDTEFGDLDDAQALEMKRLYATNKALLDKMDTYRC